MIAGLLLATAVTVKGLTVFKGHEFKYQVASRVKNCSLMPPSKARSFAIKKLPEGLRVTTDSKISGKVTANEGLYTFGLVCSEQSFDVSIQVRETE